MASSRLAGTGAPPRYMETVKSYGWRTLSFLIFFGIWEFAGRVPISIAFPTFLETMRALFAMFLSRTRETLPRRGLKSSVPRLGVREMHHNLHVV